MKQRIIIPNRISHTIFSLPCVEMAGKTPDGMLVYVIITPDGSLQPAFPGDTLIQEDDGSWHIEDKRPSPPEVRPISDGQ